MAVRQPRKRHIANDSRPHEEVENLLGWGACVAVITNISGKKFLDAWKKSAKRWRIDETANTLAQSLIEHFSKHHSGKGSGAAIACDGTAVVIDIAFEKAGELPKTLAQSFVALCGQIPAQLLENGPR